MAFDHRKFLPRKLFDSGKESVGPNESVVLTTNEYSLPPSHSQKHVSYGWILALCVLGAIFLIVSYLIIVKYRSSFRNFRRRRSMRESQPLDDENLRQDFIDENQGPVVDHHIWYIRTVGLPQSVIDSIGMFKYQKGEGSVDGSDCAVCLSVFEEDESLRLLPKCSHVFHVPCIDTWLRSHKNCPVCRAPIVITQSSNEVSTAEMSSSTNSVTSEDNQTENHFETRIEMETDEEMRRGAEILFKSRNNFVARNKGLRVLSDLVDHRVKVDEPMRNSVSMDFDSALMVYEAMNVKKGEGSSEAVEKPNSDVINPSIFRLMKSSSYGRSMQKGPVSMKRSFSCSRPCFMNKHSKSQESVPVLSELGIQFDR